MVSFCLNAAVLASVAYSAYRAGVIVSIERVSGASLAFGSLLLRLGDELLARSTLRHCQRREQLVCWRQGEGKVICAARFDTMRW